MIKLKKEAQLPNELDGNNLFAIDKSNGQMTITTSLDTLHQTRLDTESQPDVSHPVTTPVSIVRYCVASLGLLCAIVSCYAQMVFCIAIVEMVLPSHDDYNNNLIVDYTNNSTVIQQYNTCPIDANYKSFYDQWRFDKNLNKTSTNDDSENTRNISIHNNNVDDITTTKTRQQLKIIFDKQDKFNWDASQQGKTTTTNNVNCFIFLLLSTLSIR